MPLTDEEKERVLAYFGKASAEDKSAAEADVRVHGPDVTSALGSLIAPSAANVGAEAMLTYFGVPELGAIPTLARSAAAGLTNLVTSKAFPESLGGQPNSSAAADFAWGAVPESLSLGLRSVPPWLAERSAAKGISRLSEEGRKVLLDPNNYRVQQSLLEPAQDVPFKNIPSAGPALTLQTNEARAPIVGTIAAARKRYGTPIGQAYEALKDLPPMTEDDVDSIADSAQGVLKDMKAPGPLTRKYTGILNGMRKPEEGEAESIMRPIELPDGSVVVPGAAKMSPEALRLQGYSEAQIKKLTDKAEWKPPTWDQMRELRQRINLDQQKAQGGDYYGLGMLQDELDDRLMNYLPDNMKDLRTQYRGFIHRWGYAKEHALMNLSDANAVADATFKNPTLGRNLMAEAQTPEQKDQIRSRFIQYVWGDLYGSRQYDTAADQSKYVRAKLAPYLTNSGAAKEMLGPNAGQHMTNMVSWAKHAPNLSQAIENDKRYRDFLESAARHYFLEKGMNPDRAIGNAMRDLMSQIPEQRNVVGIAANTPFQMGQTTKAGHSMSRMLAARHGGMAALGIAMGRPESTMYQAAMAISWLSSGQGYEASLRFPNTTRMLLNSFKASNPRTAGYWFARAMDSVIHTGAQATRQAAMPVEGEE